MGGSNGQFEDAVVFSCICGGQIALKPELLGVPISCPHCHRFLRAGLRFLLVDQDRAPNLTVQCRCGHFVVAPPTSMGKRQRCKVCRRDLIMPQPVVKFNTNGVVRVPKRVLENQLKKPGDRKRGTSKAMTKLESASHSGRISLRPGEHICVNLECGALLPARANVCPKCGTNRLTGETYAGPGPESDPAAKWKET